MEIIVALAVLAALAALWTSARAAITVCVLEVREGEARVVRGGIAPGVLSDLRDVVARPKIERATLRIVRDAGYARLEVKGDVSQMQRQQLRNVVGSVPLGKLVNARSR